MSNLLPIVDGPCPTVNRMVLLLPQHVARPVSAYSRAPPTAERRRPARARAPAPSPTPWSWPTRPCVPQVRRLSAQARLGPPVRQVRPARCPQRAFPSRPRLRSPYTTPTKPLLTKVGVMYCRTVTSITMWRSWLPLQAGDFGPVLPAPCMKSPPSFCSISAQKLAFACGQRRGVRQRG